MAYIGEAAVISVDTTGTAWQNPFYAAVPPSAFWFAFVMAVLAAIVASQAMITACFSILSQAMTLSCFPQLKVILICFKTMVGFVLYYLFEPVLTCHQR